MISVWPYVIYMEKRSELMILNISVKTGFNGKYCFQTLLAFVPTAARNSKGLQEQVFYAEETEQNGFVLHESILIHISLQPSFY